MGLHYDHVRTQEPPNGGQTDERILVREIKGTSLQGLVGKDRLPTMQTTTNRPQNTVAAIVFRNDFYFEEDL